MSTSVTTKKTYDNKKYNNYGKYYTFKRLRNIMSTYLRSKLSFSLIANKAQYDNQNAWGYFLVYRPTGAGQDTVTVSVPLYTLFRSCNKFGQYLNLFGYYKPRGMLIEIIPGAEVAPLQAYDDTIFAGSVAVGLTTSNVGQNYLDIVELNMHAVFDSRNRVRKYWRFFIKDFSELHDEANWNPQSWPYRLCIAQSNPMAQNTLCQRYIITVTFYVTYRQAIS